MTGLDSFITFRNSQAVQGRGTLIHVARGLVVFEVYNPFSIVQFSEVLQDLRLRQGERDVYHGRAVVSNLVATGLMYIVSATLVDPWKDLTGLVPGRGLQQEVQAFVREWEASYVLSPGYQLAVSNIGAFLGELSRWLEQVEVLTRAESPNAPSPRSFVEEVEAPLLPKVGELFAGFEQVAGGIDPDVLPAHKAFAQRELHPLLLCSPFIYRIFAKPLGYAGDYEMVNMILGDRLAGTNVYSRIVNSFFLSKETAVAHRNRIDMLIERLTAESKRVAGQGRPLRVLNIGCGPASEVERFIRQAPESSHCEFHLLDFNAETLEYARTRIAQAERDSGRKPPTQFIHKSIHDLLKEAAREVAGTRAAAPLEGSVRGPGDEPDTRSNGTHGPSYDLVYCAGLFDYLSDKVCSRLLQLFEAWTAPGGLVTATNVHPTNPLRYFMDHIVDWHLVYRTEADMDALVPREAGGVVCSDATGVNVFLDIRKRSGQGAASHDRMGAGTTG